MGKEKQFTLHLSSFLENSMAKELADCLFSSESVPSIKAHLLKGSLLPLPLEPVPWSIHGYYLDKKKTFITDPLWHAGYYYVQEASSMFIDLLAQQCLQGIPFPMVLDACAAPGGKSVGLLNVMSGKGLLVSNETNRQRSKILQENLNRWGFHNFLLTASPAHAFEAVPGCFDLIICDAPCSGEGMIRKDRRVMDIWNAASIEKNSEKQKFITSHLWNSLKPGGFFIYSTCTFNPEENEKVVEYLCRKKQAEVIFFPHLLNHGIVNLRLHNINAYRFFPHLTKGEGFFCAVLRKSGNSPIHSYSHSATLSSSPYFTQPVTLLPQNNIIYSATVHPTLSLIKKASILLLHNGIPVMKKTGQDIRPLQDLVTHAFFNKDALPAQEASLSSLYAYLRKKELPGDMPSPQKAGYFYYQYKQNPIALAKQLNTRINNLYPTERRILHEYSDLFSLLC